MYLKVAFIDLITCSGIFKFNQFNLLPFLGRFKIAPLENEIDVLFNSMNGAVETFSCRIESIFNEGYARHIDERIKLRKFQDASIEHVILKMYPDLSIFDTTLQNRKTNKQLPSKEYVYSDTQEEEGDMEISYKTS